MRKLRLASSVLFATVIVWGCGKETSTEKVTDSTQAKISSEIKPDAQKGAADSVTATTSEQAKQMAESASEIADSTVQRAQQLIDQAMQHINDGRLDLAESAMTQLESIEDSLPESLKNQIENLRNLFAAKQSSEDVSKTAESVQGLLPSQDK